MPRKVLFLTLKIFSATGGIEKVCRVAGKALYEDALLNYRKFTVYCMHDTSEDAAGNMYFPSEIFRAFGGKKPFFVTEAVKEGARANVVLISHINLLIVGWLIKKISPSTRIILLAHGIEIWRNISAAKKRMLACCSEIVAVSHYTKNSIVNNNYFPAHACTVLNNCLDPYLELPENSEQVNELRNKYRVQAHEKVLFTLSRLSSKERYKGYDKVIEALGHLSMKNVKYIIAGSCDEKEKEYIHVQIHKLGLDDRVVLTGFVPEKELAAHFKLANVYVMPSTKEGFGIVFIEAMYYGVPVIAGSADGSVDALLNGKLGKLVDPFNVDEMAVAIEDLLTGKNCLLPNRRLLFEHFGFDTYKEKLSDILLRTLTESN